MDARNDNELRAELAAIQRQPLADWPRLLKVLAEDVARLLQSAHHGRPLA
jgi:hypothetical protein